jgi:hypothetical protein
VKKNLMLAAALIAAGCVFAQEYTIYFSGSNEGTVTVTKDRGGSITIRCISMKNELGHNSGLNIGNGELVDSYLCPLLPKGRSFNISTGTVIIIEGNTTTQTWSDGSWKKTVVDGNTTTETWSDGYWVKTVVDGNTTTETLPNGSWKKTVVDGNTTTETYADGNWYKTVVNGNTTTVTHSNGSWTTKTRTVAKDTVTEKVTSSSPYFPDISVRKGVATKQGNNIYFREVGAGTLSASGNAYYDQKDYGKAIAEFTEAMELDPNYADAYAGRARAYYAQKNYDRAIADYTEAIRLKPTAYCYDNRGLAYLMKKDTARARADWNKALELDPKDDYARQMLEKYR